LDYGQTGLSSPLTSTLTIPSGELSVSFSVDIMDDKISEQNETFIVTIDLQPSYIPVLFSSNQSFTITIIDDEGNDILVW